MLTSYFKSTFDDTDINVFEFNNIGLIGIENPIIELNNRADKQSVFSRITIPEKENDLKIVKQLINSNREKFDILVVEPLTAPFASYAVRNPKVDIIKLTPNSSLSVFNARYSNRIIENNKIVELDISFFFKIEIAKNLRPLYRILETFKIKKMQFCLSNFPRKSSQVRSYRGLQSLGKLLGLSNRVTTSSFMEKRIIRNREKIFGNQIYEGVSLDGSEN